MQNEIEKILQKEVDTLAELDKIVKDGNMRLRDICREHGYAVDFINRKLIKK